MVKKSSTIETVKKEIRQTFSRLEGKTFKCTEDQLSAEVWSVLCDLRDHGEIDLALTGEIDRGNPVYQATLLARPKPTRGGSDS